MLTVCFFFPLWQTFSSLTSPPPTREWMEIGIHPELCVGTVRRALSKVNNVLQSELDSLKKDGKVNFYCSIVLKYSNKGKLNDKCIFYLFPKV